MAKVKVKVLDAVVDGHKKDAVISIEEKSAKHLESIGYVEIQKSASEKKADDNKEEK